MIETKRLIIRPLNVEELLKYVESPNELAGYLGLHSARLWIEPETKEAILRDLLPHLKNPEKDPVFYTLWIVIEKTLQVIAGGICFHGAPDQNGEVEIGYGTDDAYRNQGIMTETLSGVIDWIKKNKKAEKIIAETDCENIPSQRVLEKTGFKIVTSADTSLIWRLDLKNEPGK